MNKKKLPTWAIVLIAIFVVAIIGGAMGNSDSDTQDSKEQTGTTSVKKEDLELEDGHTGALDEYGIAYYIDGYVKNNSDKEFSYVQIEFITYDSEGNTLGSCIDNNSGLEADGRWKFKAICTGEVDKIASYKLKEITKY